MPYRVYQISEPVTVVFDENGRHKLVQLPVGSVFRTTNLKPDRDGMIQGTCRGKAVLMFSRDLEDCAK